MERLGARGVYSSADLAYIVVMKQVTVTRVVPAHFPELAKLVWNRDPVRPIPAEDAFHLYERNWRFVEPELIGEREKCLIELLNEQYACGFDLPILKEVKRRQMKHELHAA